MSFEIKSILRNGSGWAASIARLVFGTTIVLMPFRLRYVFAARPVPEIYKDFTDFLLFGSDIAVLALLLSWAISLLLDPRPVRFGPKIIWIPAFGLVLISLLTSYTSLDVALSLYHTLRLAALFLFYLYIVNEIRSAWIIYVSVAVQVITQSLVGLAQFFLQSSVGLQSFGEHSLDPAVRGISIVSTGITRVLRAYGLTEHPNILGGCLAFSMILLFSMYVHERQRTPKGLVLVLSLGLPGLFVTFSRSAWLAIMSGMALFLWAIIAARDWRTLASVFRLGLMGLVLLTPLIWSYSAYLGARLNVADSFEKNPFENQSIRQRLLLDAVGFKVFVDKPVTGIGLGASALAIHKYSIVNAIPPHFVLLAVAMETGLFGLTFYLLLMFLPFAAIARLKINLFVKPFLFSASVLLMAINLVGFFDIYPWLLPPGRLWQWLAWGLWAVSYEQEAGNVHNARMSN